MRQNEDHQGRILGDNMARMERECCSLPSTALAMEKQDFSPLAMRWVADCLEARPMYHIFLSSVYTLKAGRAVLVIYWR